MDLITQASQAQLFLNYYIRGGAFVTTPSSEPFKNSAYPGIVLRQPALLDIRPEYTPLPQAGDGLRVLSPSASAPPSAVVSGSVVEGPEGQGDYTFLDRCALRHALVSNQGGQLVVDFFFVPNFLANEYQESHPSVASPAPHLEAVRLPQSLYQLDFIVRECLSQLEDYLGLDPVDPNANFAGNVQILTFAQFLSDSRFN